MLEVSFIDRSFQPPAAPAVGVCRSDVVLALARHLQPGLLQRRNDSGAVANLSLLDPLEEVVADRASGISLHSQPRPQPPRLDVGSMARLLQPRAGRIIRPAPVVFVVLPIS